MTVITFAHDYLWKLFVVSDRSVAIPLELIQSGFIGSFRSNNARTLKYNVSNTDIY